jgi:hypothetical protein
MPSPSMLVWTRGNMLLAGAQAASPAAPNPVGTSGLAGRVFYFLDDEDDLKKHVGQEIEIRGDLEDFEDGEVEITREGEFTEIELDFDGKEEKMRVPTAWLGATAASDEKEQELQIVGGKALLRRLGEVAHRHERIVDARRPPRLRDLLGPLVEGGGGRR